VIRVQWCIYHWATWAMPPPWTAKISCVWQKNATKMRHFQAKISKKIWGGGTAPSQTLPPLGREIPLTRPLTLGAAALDPLQSFPNFYHYARLRCCYWRIWEIESSASIVSRPRPIRWNALEVGPVNIQSSHWISLLIQFVMDWHTPANSIINIKHSFCIRYDIYTPKHTFFMTILWTITCKCAWKNH